LDRSEIIEAIETVIKSAKNNGVAVGIVALAKECEKWLRAGMNLLSIGSVTGLLAEEGKKITT